MKKRKILIVRWGQIRIHDYYLANLLTLVDCDVEFAFYTPSYAYRDKHIVDLLAQVKEKYTCHEFFETFFKKQFIRLNTLLERLFKKSFPSLSSGFLLPRALRKTINLAHYDYIIPIEQHALYWIAHADKTILPKTLYYSLEIQKIRDSDVGMTLKPVLLEEKKWVHSGLLGLIIQDKFRAEALLECKVEEAKLKTLYLPVFVPGMPSLSKSNFLSDKLNLRNDKKIILYFGEVYEERKLPELTEAFNDVKAQDYVLVFHGSKHYKNIIKPVPNKVIISEAFVPFEQINQVIASAHIGLAFYDNHKLNTRYTAFSSEKITRYLQCGVPFIAFKNETFSALNDLAECAYLIDDFSELETALSTIEKAYDFYSKNALKAFTFFSMDSQKAASKAFFDTLSPECVPN